MAVIALAALIVIANDPRSRAPVEQTVLVAVSAGRHGLRQASQYDVDDRSIFEFLPMAAKQHGLHVGDYANILGVVNKYNTQHEPCARDSLKALIIGDLNNSGNL